MAWEVLAKKQQNLTKNTSVSCHSLIWPTGTGIFCHNVRVSPTFLSLFLGWTTAHPLLDLDQLLLGLNVQLSNCH
jgi:hypothetical protein